MWWNPVHFFWGTNNVVIEKQKPILDPKERELCEAIVTKVYDRFIEQRIEIESYTNNNKLQYGLVFIQSKSWKKVEQMLSDVKLTAISVDKWAETWLIRIHKLRNWQKDIHRLTNAKCPKLQTKSAWLQQKSDWLQQKHKSICKELMLAKQELGQGNYPQQVKSVESIVSFLKENWDYLTAFSKTLQNAQTIPMDEEKMFVTLIPETQSNPSLMEKDKSIKAIFLIQEKSWKTKETLFTDENSKICSKATTAVRIAKEHLPSSPSEDEEKDSSFELTDEYFFDAQFAELEDPETLCEDPETLKDNLKISEKGKRLQAIVNLALPKVNNKLAGDHKGSNHNFNQEQDTTTHFLFAWK